MSGKSKAIEVAEQIVSDANKVLSNTITLLDTLEREGIQGKKLFACRGMSTASRSNISEDD